MIQRPPACEKHAAELPGKALIVDQSQCPFCWAEDRESQRSSFPKATGFCHHYRATDEHYHKTMEELEGCRR